MPQYSNIGSYEEPSKLQVLKLGIDHAVTVLRRPEIVLENEVDCISSTQWPQRGVAKKLSEKNVSGCRVIAK